MFTPATFTSVINSYLPEPHASLLNGIIFGVNLKTSAVFYHQLQKTGLLHIVVLSGTNITILSAIIGSITLFFGRRISILITILTIILFIVFVGPQAPIIRAGIMGILTFVAILTGRKSYALYLLFLSGILSLMLLPLISLFYPRWFQPLSFFLSYAATLGIILFGSKNSFKTSIAAQVFTVPIIFIYFRQISLIAPLSNLLVSSLIAPLMILGFITSILGKIHFFLGLPFGYICYGILSYILAVVDLLSRLPCVYFQF